MLCSNMIAAIWIVITTLLTTSVDCKSWVEEDPDNPGFKRRCIEDLDCFTNAYPWYDFPKRSASLVPEECEYITYNLYTPYNKEEPYLLESDRENILNSPFNASWPTQIYMHAYWADQMSLDRELEKKDAALLHHEFNVIVPDFRDHVQIPYFRAIANVRVIAARIAKFLRLLMKYTGIKPQSIHLIGFSLGCHTCGYIGKRIPNLGRITALSPAGRNFIGTADETRLVPSDALFVDVYFSSGDGDYGVQELDSDIHNGHQNFFVNGAERQPGCSLLSTPFTLLNFIKDFPETYCDHIRTNTLWMESMSNKDCKFKAIKCRSYEAFKNGECTSENSPVVDYGLLAKQEPDVEIDDSLFIETGSEEPFCNENNIIPRALWYRPPDPLFNWFSDQ